MRISRRAATTLGIMGGTFLAAIEATVVATAMPTVVTQLGGLAHYSWVFSGYMLTSAVTMPLWGRLSDMYGRRRFYLLAVGFFLLGSALSGASQSMGQLIVFRAIQGVGAGGLLPLGMTMLGDLYTLRERARMQGLFSGVWGLASLLGPLTGGLVTEALSWRWVFYLNLPFGFVAAALVGLTLVEPTRGRTHRMDYRGALLMMGTIATLMLALGQTGAPDGVVPGLAVAGLYGLAIALGVAFFRGERRSQEPILPLDLLTNRLVSSINTAGFLIGLAMFGALSFVPLFVQTVRGGSAADAGRALTPLVCGWVSMSIVSGRLLPRVGHRPLVTTGISLVVIGFGGLLTVDSSSSRFALLASLGLMGMGMGTAMLSLLLVLQNSVPRERLGVATSVGQFARSIGGAVGVSVMGAIVAASLPPGGAASPALMQIALHRAFVAGAVVAVAALAASLRIPAHLPAGPRDGAPDA